MNDQSQILLAMKRKKQFKERKMRREKGVAGAIEKEREEGDSAGNHMA
ncbi:hypothetical protein COLO4_31991 [Corchorus olitorius]|uniref:Uncharacterized protein n=1 Tax=Corchorus olitorius TaxID=93759 RepID=A0A1R3H2L4_9ROSI|nr:hypothetical protein COLO4_31991 [Corchorus olitorius]